MKKKKKRGEEFSMEGRLHVTKIFAKFSHDAPLPMIKKKHLTIEQLNARRRKVWLTIAKKEIPKVQPFFFGIPLSFVTRTISISSIPALIYAFIVSFQAFKQKVSAKNFVLTNARKVRDVYFFITYHRGLKEVSHAH